MANPCPKDAIVLKEVRSNCILEKDHKGECSHQGVTVTWGSNLRVVAVALHVEFNGYELTFSVPAPGRHSDVISAMNNMGLGDHCRGREIQGFLLNDGTFVRRAAALRVARMANQIIRQCGGDERELFSENVW